MSLLLTLTLVAGETAGTERTWLGWASGFVAALVVLAIAAGLVALIRRRR